MAQIAIYDSGVGGLSVYQHAQLKCSQHDYLFVCDNQAFPYGTKPELELIDRVTAVVTRLDKQFSIDVLIVACNTASTIVLQQLRSGFDFHIIGVVPAIKPAAEQSLSKNIGLLATPATVERRYTEELISTFAYDCKVTRIGSSELVQLAEDKLYGRPVDKSDLASILQPIICDHTIDVLVLACTHFPLLREEIALVLIEAGREVIMIDSGEAIANRLSTIEQASSLNLSSKPRRTAIMTNREIDTDFSDKLTELGFTQFVKLAV